MSSLDYHSETSSDPDEEFEARRFKEMYDIEGSAVPTEKQEESSCCCCARLMDWLRSKYWYHLFAFIAHYVAFAIAIFTTVASYFFNTTITSAAGVVSLFIIFSVICDIWLLDHHYHRETFFPYCAAPHLLFLVKRKRCDPCPPPYGRLYFMDKLLIFWQGYIFVVIPYQNLIRTLDRHKHSTASEFDKAVLLLTLIQLCVTLVAWFMFVLFYITFLLEVLIRFFFFPCLRLREAERRYKTIRNHFLASDYRDPWFYKPYAWIYENM